MDIKYRNFNESDSKFIKSLMYELGYSVSEKELISNIHEILYRGGAIFIAEVDSRVVGCVCSVIDARVAEGIYGELVSLVVSEKFRGSGVGKGLVRIGEKWITVLRAVFEDCHESIFRTLPAGH